MRRGYLTLLALSVLVTGLLPAFAELPVPMAEVAPVDDLAYEVNDRVDDLGKLLESAETFDEKKDDVRRGFGVLAVVGQAIAEHPDHDDTEIQGAALRDGALKYKKKSAYEEAKAAFEEVKAASAGTATGEHSLDHNWAKLCNMHPMMEEIEERSGKINKVVRRPRGKPNEPVHASVIAVLTLAMHADTHEVKNPDDVAKWQSLAKEYLGQMTGVAQAVREKDKATAAELMKQATVTCDKCHEAFRD